MINESNALRKLAGELKSKSVQDEIYELTAWLASRPSACLDPFVDQIPGKLARLSELKARRRTERRATTMMESQRVPDELEE